MDKVYSNVKKGYRSIPLPHLGQPDHLFVLLIPAYTPLRRKTPTTTSIVKKWPEGASSQVQDCFERTNWDVFENQELEEYTSTLLCYIKNCVDNVTVDKHIWIYSNQKPWMTRGVRTLLKERNAAFGSRDKALYSAARANLKKGRKSRVQGSRFFYSSHTQLYRI